MYEKCFNEPRPRGSGLPMFAMFATPETWTAPSRSRLVKARLLVHVLRSMSLTHRAHASPTSSPQQRLVLRPRRNPSIHREMSQEGLDPARSKCFGVNKAPRVLPVVQDILPDPIAIRLRGLARVMLLPAGIGDLLKRLRARPNRRVASRIHAQQDSTNAKKYQTLNRLNDHYAG